jgi:hypothetical protein
MEKRFLFNRIALHARGISPRHVQLSTAVEPNLADSNLSFGNRATMPARVAANPVAIEFFVEYALSRVLGEKLAKRRHKNLEELPSARVIGFVRGDWRYRPRDLMLVNPFVGLLLGLDHLHVIHT